MMPKIAFTLEDKFGARAVAFFDGDLIPMNTANADMDSFRPVDVREFVIYDKDYVYKWRAPGEFVGVKP
jgi:hypothetical protein